MSLTLTASRALRHYHAPGVYFKMDDDGYSMRLRVTVLRPVIYSLARPVSYLYQPSYH